MTALVRERSNTSATGPAEDVPGRLLSDRPELGDPGPLAAHLAERGPLSLGRSSDTEWRHRMWSEMAASGLTGRGGAAFPTAAKWNAVLRACRRSPMVVVNAMEGEPASRKDQLLLSRSPHLVLDGAEVTAAVLGATDVAVCVGEGRAAAAVGRAVLERATAGVAACRVAVHRPPARYLTGEESALSRWLDGGTVRPTFRVDKSVPLRVSGHPVVVHNAETMAQVALIARYGPQWFRERGTPESPGTTLVTLSGAIAAAVVEVDLGTPILDVLRRVGIGADVSGVLIGGYGGTWLGPDQLSVSYAPRPLASIGAAMGVGVMVVMPPGGCGLTETARVVRYMAGESAGQCGPCTFGLPALADDLEELAAGRADTASSLERRTAVIDGRGACGHPDGVVRLVRSALTVFAADVEEHRAGRPCGGHRRPTAMTLPDNGDGRAT